MSWVNDNGKVDLIRDGIDIQQKFVNAGGRFSLGAVAEHLHAYPDFVQNGGKYQIPSDHFRIQATLKHSFHVFIDHEIYVGDLFEAASTQFHGSPRLAHLSCPLEDEWFSVWCGNLFLKLTQYCTFHFSASNCHACIYDLPLSILCVLRPKIWHFCQFFVRKLGYFARFSDVICAAHRRTRVIAENNKPLRPCRTTYRPSSSASSVCAHSPSDRTLPL